MFKADLDTFISVPRLLASGFEKHDWSGGYGPPYGGTGYFLSAKAMRGVLEAAPTEPGAEDDRVAEKLRSKGFRAIQDDRYNWRTAEGPTWKNDVITVHQYSEKDARDVERFLGFQERIDRFSKYFEEAKKIQ